MFPLCSSFFCRFSSWNITAVYMSVVCWEPFICVLVSQLLGFCPPLSRTLVVICVVLHSLLRTPSSMLALSPDSHSDWGSETLKGVHLSLMAKDFENLEHLLTMYISSACCLFGSLVIDWVSYLLISYLFGGLLKDVFWLYRLKCFAQMVSHFHFLFVCIAVHGISRHMISFLSSGLPPVLEACCRSCPFLFQLDC